MVLHMLHLADHGHYSFTTTLALQVGLEHKKLPHRKTRQEINPVPNLKREEEMNISTEIASILGVQEAAVSNLNKMEKILNKKRLTFKIVAPHAFEDAENTKWYVSVFEHHRYAINAYGDAYGKTYMDAFRKALLKCLRTAKCKTLLERLREKSAN
jgi:hypothetical protein